MQAARKLEQEAFVPEEEAEEADDEVTFGSDSVLRDYSHQCKFNHQVAHILHVCSTSSQKALTNEVNGAWLRPVRTAMLRVKGVKCGVLLLV